MSDTTYERIPGGRIDAMQLLDTPERRAELFEWTGEDFQPTNGVLPDKLWVRANKAQLDLEVGEWVAKDSLGFYPIKDEVFKRSWRKAWPDASPRTAGMSAGDTLAYLGVDAAKWSEEFVETHRGLTRDGDDGLDPAPGGWVFGWFANAIEAGISEGYARARRTQEHGND